MKRKRKKRKEKEKFSKTKRRQFLFRFLNKLCDFFKPDQLGGFNEILLNDSLSNVTCRSLMAFADLLVYPCQPSASHIRFVASNIARALLTNISDALNQVGVRRFSVRQ